MTTLSVTGSGFKQYEQTSVKVAAQEFKTIDVSLVLGANTEIVEVREAGAAASSGLEPVGAMLEPPLPDDGADYGADWQAGETDDES